MLTGHAGTGCPSSRCEDPFVGTTVSVPTSAILSLCLSFHDTPESQRSARTEPVRFHRRLHSLRGWSYDETSQAEGP